MSKKVNPASENYLETILELEKDNEGVRSVDVAALMGVSKPSVNKAIKILQSAGMAEQLPYGSITLTHKGRKVAKEVRRKHDLLKCFLVELLGIDSEIAEVDACKMEHVVSDDTINKLTEYLERVLKDR
jgi:DtxR family Mn-dependent transcriptional regulator